VNPPETKRDIPQTSLKLPTVAPWQKGLRNFFIETRRLREKDVSCATQGKGGAALCTVCQRPDPAGGSSL